VSQPLKDLSKQAAVQPIIVTVSVRTFLVPPYQSISLDKLNVDMPAGQRNVCIRFVLQQYRFDSVKPDDTLGYRFPKRLKQDEFYGIKIWKIWGDKGVKAEFWAKPKQFNEVQVFDRNDADGVYHYSVRVKNPRGKDLIFDPSIENHSDGK
jgi:hypothetical protein